jgi:hypothetical protein
LDPEPDWIRIGIQSKMLDPDPNSMNTDPKPWSKGTTGVNDTSSKFATVINDTDHSSPCVIATGGKFATGVNNTGGKLPPVSMTPASLTPVANN